MIIAERFLQICSTGIIFFEKKKWVSIFYLFYSDYLIDYNTKIIKNEDFD